MKTTLSWALRATGAAIVGLTIAVGAGSSLAQGSTATGPAPAGLAKATFAGGCFWCVESDFDKVTGVVSTTSGYIGGKVANPSYEQVSAKTTGHAEAVEIVFDPRRVSYAQLLEYFWRTIDPTTKDRQFCDSGSPYRTAIYTHDAAQAAAAQASLAALEKSKPFKEPVVTGQGPPHRQRLRRRERRVEPRDRLDHPPVRREPVQQLPTQRRPRCWVTARQQRLRRIDIDPT